MKAMSEPTVSCPKCKTEIKLTESLAAPLVEATRRDFEKRLAQKEGDWRLRENELRQQEALKAKALLATELDGRTREIQQLNEVLKQNNEKLAEAQRSQAICLQKERALADKTRELDLTVEKRVQENLTSVRVQARLEADDQYKLRVHEKEQTIASMQKQIEDLRRKAEQGSQQTQGEVLEQELESLLRAKFPFDRVEPVPKGEHGGDVLQRVRNPQGGECGAILWETKRTKSWSDGWLAKLREDQRAAQAEIAVIVSFALPKDVDTFELVEGVWVTHPKTMLPVAFSLRQMLLEVSSVRHAAEGHQTKAEMMYGYLTGSRFRQRVQAMVESFSCMQDDLAKERKVMLKQWAKRQEQIDRAMEATAGMFGDLQGIAGKSIQEIEGLDLDGLDEVRQLSLTA